MDFSGAFSIIFRLNKSDIQVPSNSDIYSPTDKLYFHNREAFSNPALLSLLHKLILSSSLYYMNPHNTQPCIQHCFKHPPSLWP